MKNNYASTIFGTEKKPKAAVFVVHGMEEHRYRYEEFAKFLADNGIAVITYDLPGHGETDTGEDRGWFGESNGWNNLVNSAVDMAVVTKKQFPGAPLFLFGHSMGSMIGRCFLQLHDGLIDGMILSGAPAYTPAAPAGVLTARVEAVKYGKKGHSALLDQLATGGFNKGIENPRTPADWLSYNDENVDRYIADPDSGFPFTIQGYRDLFEGMIRMNDLKQYRCYHPELPIYMVAGEDDPCIGGEAGFSASAERLRQAGYNNVGVRLFPGMRHEILQEKEKQIVFDDILSWILARV